MSDILPRGQADRFVTAQHPTSYVHAEADLIKAVQFNPNDRQAREILDAVRLYLRGTTR